MARDTKGRFSTKNKNEEKTNDFNNPNSQAGFSFPGELNLKKIFGWICILLPWLFIVIIFGLNKKFREFDFKGFAGEKLEGTRNAFCSAACDNEN